MFGEVFNHDSAKFILEGQENLWIRPEIYVILFMDLCFQKQEMLTQNLLEENIMSFKGADTSKSTMRGYGKRCPQRMGTLIQDFYNRKTELIIPHKS